MPKANHNNNDNAASQDTLNLTPIDKVLLQLVVGYFLENPMPKRVVFAVAEKLNQSLADTSDMIKSLTDKLADGVQLNGALGPAKFPGEGKAINRHQRSGTIVLNRVIEDASNAEQHSEELVVSALSLFEWQLMDYYANAEFPRSNRFSAARALKAPFDQVKSSTWDLMHWGHLTVIEHPKHPKVLQLFANMAVPPLAALTDVEPGLFRPSDAWLDEYVPLAPENTKNSTQAESFRNLKGVVNEDLNKLLKGLSKSKLSVVKYFIQAANDKGVFSNSEAELPHGRESYIRRENRKETIVEFLNRVYEDVLDGTFTRAQLRMVDYSASNALYNYERRHGRVPLEEMYLPKKAERVTKDVVGFDEKEDEMAREILRVAGVVQRRRDRKIRLQHQHMALKAK